MSGAGGQQEGPFAALGGADAADAKAQHGKWHSMRDAGAAGNFVWVHYAKKCIVWHAYHVVCRGLAPRLKCGSELLTSDSLRFWMDLCQITRQMHAAMERQLRQ